MLPRVPRLTFRGTHAIDHAVDGVLEPRTVEIRELTADREHPPIRLPPHPQPSRGAAGPGLLPRGGGVAWAPSAPGGGRSRAPHRPQTPRRTMRRPPRPLRITRLVRQLRDRPQLLPTQRAS